MPNRTITTLRPVVDESSLERTNGGLIAWANVSAVTADALKTVPAFTVVGKKASGELVPRASTILLTSVSVTSNVATATAATGHGLAVGDTVFIAGASLAYVNGTKTIASVSGDTITFTATGANASATGTITLSWAAIGMIEATIVNGARGNALTGFGVVVGGVLYENLLPDATGTPKVLPAQYKTELTAAGCTFKFAQYGDSR